MDLLFHFEMSEQLAAVPKRRSIVSTLVRLSSNLTLESAPVLNLTSS